MTCSLLPVIQMTTGSCLGLTRTESLDDENFALRITSQRCLRSVQSNAKIVSGIDRPSFPEARRCLFLSTWFSALSRITCRQSTGRAISDWKSGGFEGVLGPGWEVCAGRRGLSPSTWRTVSPRFPSNRRTGGRNGTFGSLRDEAEHHEEGRNNSALLRNK